MIRRLLLFPLLLAALWVAAMTALPIFFLHHVEKKYAVTLKGQKHFAWYTPQVHIKNASFIWNDKVELINGDFQIEIDPQVWFKSRQWMMHLKGDGARLRFLGDWQRKTGVKEVETTRLRLSLQFSNEGLSDIETIDLVSPTYQLQIHGRRPA